MGQGKGQGAGALGLQSVSKAVITVPGGCCWCGARGPGVGAGCALRVRWRDGAWWALGYRVALGCECTTCGALSGLAAVPDCELVRAQGVTHRAWWGKGRGARVAEGGEGALRANLSSPQESHSTLHGDDVVTFNHGLLHWGLQPVGMRVASQRHNVQPSTLTLTAPQPTSTTPSARPPRTRAASRVWR